MQRRAWLRGTITTALVAVAIVTVGPATAQSPPPAVAGIVEKLAGQHPAAYYQQAAALFKEGRRDDAVFLFYLGQLRFRTHLTARRATLKPDADPAVFSSLSEVLGRPLNEYAFGDIPSLVKTIDAVLAYDRANPDTFTPPDQFAEAHANVRDGLQKLRISIEADIDSIRAMRLRNGLQNRN